MLSLEGEATSIEGFRMRKLDLGRQWARTESEIDEKKSVKWWAVYHSGQLRRK